MPPLPLDSDEYKALLRLSDLLIQKVVTWIARRAPYEGDHKPAGNKYSVIVLKLAPKITKQEIVIPDDLPNVLRLAIIFRKKAAEFDEKRKKQNKRNTKSSKTKRAKKSGAKAAKRCHKAAGKEKKHREEITIAEKSLRELLKSVKIGPMTNDEPAENHEQVDVEDSPPDVNDDEETHRYPLSFPPEDFGDMLAEDLLTESDVEAHNRWASQPDNADTGSEDDSDSASESDTSDD
ncbi:MAG: hypothetical protein L6R42_003246 [Xanthoria sp. 1 TBL-2021]|nr:MAG: hypothetical protein L6R42_003246 [Xanthoria sp. 1 TBL-2021]